MKTNRLILTAIAVLGLSLATPLAFTGCVTPPKTQVVEVQTLKSVGQAAEAALTLSAQLYGDHKITAEQARKVADLYDKQFQPIFRVAVIAAKSDLSTIASPDLINLASQLAALVAQFQTK